MKNKTFTSPLFMNLYKKMMKAVLLSALGASVMLAGCGGGDCVDTPAVVFTPEQIRTMTPAQAKGLRDIDIITMGSNFKLMNDSALAVLNDGVANTTIGCVVRKAQIESITPEQVSSLNPSQVRKIGAAESGIAKIAGLTLPAFEALVASPVQVTALTVGEYKTLPSTYFTTIGANLKFLSNPVLASFSEKFIATKLNLVSNMEAITPDQIATLSQEQIKIMGTSDGGSSKFRYLNEDAYRRLMSEPANVNLITPFDVQYLTNANIVNLGANIKFLSDAALFNFKWTQVTTATTLTSQIGAITPEQVQSLSPQQIMILSTLNQFKGLASLERLSFGALLPAQVSSLMPHHFVTATAAQLATLRETTIAALGADVRLSIRSDQKTLLAASQAAYFK